MLKSFPTGTRAREPRLSQSSRSRRDLEGTKAVVFGGLGFLGRHIADALARANAETVVYDIAERSGGMSDAMLYVQGDVLDSSAVRSALEGASRVFAFSGGGGVAASLQDPLGDLTAACMAQLVLLEAVKVVCPEATVVFPGSRLEYGRPQYLPVDEDHPLAGDSPYAVHKTACAGYYRVYAQAHGLRTIVLRLSNPYGPHFVEERYKGFGILNHFIDQAVVGRPIRLFGDGSQLRDFVHVDDVVDAVLAASDRPELAGRVLNVGAGKGVSLVQAATEVIELLGRGSIEHVAWPGVLSRVETGDFYFDISRAEELLGWEPRVAWRQGLEDTLAYYPEM